MMPGFESCYSGIKSGSSIHFELLLSERVVLDGLQERAAGIEIHPGNGKCKASAYPGALNVNHDFAPVEAALTLGG